MIAYPSNPLPPDGPSGPSSPVLPPLPPPVPQDVQPGWGEGSFSSSISTPSGSICGTAALSLAALPPQDAASPNHSVSSSLRLSVSDTQLLDALVHAPSIAAYATSRALSLTALALWLQQPEIAAAHEALLHLRALDHRTWQEQVTKEAIDTLRETMQASEDPVERRRCANTILRATARTNRPQQSRVGNHAEGAPNPTRAPATTTAPSGPLSRPRRPHQTERAGERAPSSPPSSDPSSPHSVSSSLRLSVSSDPQASPSSASTHPSSFSLHPSDSAVLAALDNKKPAPFPEDFATTPESCADHAVARLSHIPDPTGHRLYLAIYDALDIDLRDTPSHWEPFKRTLEASHFATCREGWTRTEQPLEQQANANTATRKYTFTNDATGETRSCTLALAPRNPKVDNPNHWWITHLITHNTS